MKKLSYIVLFIFASATFELHASLVKYSFSGVVTGVENNAQVIWDPSTILGATIEGYYLLDLDLLGYGREETSWYYWWNIDNRAGALSSFLQVNGQQYQITADNDFNSMYMDWQTNEYIEVTDGPVFDGGFISDSLTLVDQELFTETVTNGEIFQRQRLQINFNDPVQDFVAFPSDFSDTNPPLLDREFQWFDNDFANSEKQGNGTFDFRRIFTDDEFNSQSLIDSILNFRLTQVSAVQIPEPNRIGLILIVLAVMGTRAYKGNRQRRKNSRTSC